jgi:hypothetical protein
MKVKPSKETADLFAKAEAETQFSTAIDMIFAPDSHLPRLRHHAARLRPIRFFR